MGPNHTLLLLLLHFLTSHTTTSLPLHAHFSKLVADADADADTDEVSATAVPPPEIAVSATVNGSCGCAPAPLPSDFPNLQQYNAYLVIQQFKKSITCDPMGVTATWVGYDLCGNGTDAAGEKTKYRGIYCDSPTYSPANTTVASVDFNGYGLCAPTIAGFIDRLPDLALFHANSNNFSGTVPDLRGLRYLYELDLSNNNLTGPFPDTVLPLGGLRFLDLRFNHLVGAVPPPLFDLSVIALFINNNVLSGRIPDNLGSTTAQYLAVANNQFSGPFPRSISNASSTLSEALFLNNRLSGCLPYEIGLAENLTLLDAGENQLTGPIPLSFGCLADVEELSLAQNHLYGRVPDELCVLAKTGRLQNLSLSENYFHSVGPHCVALAKAGVLDVRRNCIPGFPEQRPAVECAWFYASARHCPFIPHIPCDLPGGPIQPASRAAMPEAETAPVAVATADWGAGFRAVHKGNGN